MIGDNDDDDDDDGDKLSLILTTLHVSKDFHRVDCLFFSIIHINKATIASFIGFLNSPQARINHINLLESQ